MRPGLRSGNDQGSDDGNDDEQDEQCPPNVPPLFLRWPLEHGHDSDDADDDEQRPLVRSSPSFLPSFLPSTMPGTYIDHPLLQKTLEVLHRQRVDTSRPTIDDQDGIDESVHVSESRKQPHQ